MSKSKKEKLEEAVDKLQGIFYCKCKNPQLFYGVTDVYGNLSVHCHACDGISSTLNNEGIVIRGGYLLR